MDFYEMCNKFQIICIGLNILILLDARISAEFNIEVLDVSEMEPGGKGGDCVQVDGCISSETDLPIRYK